MPATDRHVRTVACRALLAIRVLLVLALGGAGCGVPGRDHPPTPEGPITKAQRGQAMLSVHAHAHWPDGNFGGVEFMDFEQAIRILKEDKASGADSRVRRAVAKLWSHGYGRKEFRDAATVLLAEYGIRFKDFDDKVQVVVAEKPAIVLPPTSPEMMRSLELIMLNLLVGVTKTCPWTVPPPTGGVGTLPPPVEWKYEAKIPREVHDIARSLDPQSWGAISTFFYDSYLVDAPSCCPVPGTATSTCTFTKKPKSNDPEPGSRYAAGRPYGTTAFFENFCGGTGCPVCEGPPMCQVAFKVILCADTQYDRWVPLSCLASCAERYDVHYHFGAFLFGELQGTEGQTISGDGGSLSVREATSAEKMGLSGSDWSVVTVGKRLTFKSNSVSIGAGKVLLSFQDELRDQVVEWACHDVPAECWFSLTSP